MRGNFRITKNRIWSTIVLLAGFWLFAHLVLVLQVVEQLLNQTKAQKSQRQQGEQQFSSRNMRTQGTPTSHPHFYSLNSIILIFGEDKRTTKQLPKSDQNNQIFFVIFILSPCFSLSPSAFPTSLSAFQSISDPFSLSFQQYLSCLRI